MENEIIVDVFLKNISDKVLADYAHKMIDGGYMTVDQLAEAIVRSSYYNQDGQKEESSKVLEFKSKHEQTMTVVAVGDKSAYFLSTGYGIRDGYLLIYLNGKTIATYNKDIWVAVMCNKMK